MVRSPEAAERERARARAYQAAKRSTMTPEEHEADKAKKRAYYVENRERIRAQQAEAYKLRDRSQYAESDRDCHLRRKYGINAADYNRMLAEQDGKCAACDTADPGGCKSFHVDHDHSTGEVRGLLCGPCNRALGCARDSVEVLMSLATYLLRSQDVLTMAQEV